MWNRYWMLLLPALLIAALMLSGAGQLEAGSQAKDAGSESKSEEEALKKPAALVVTMHADWCGTCKRLEPTLSEVRKDVKEKPVLFMKLDLTDADTRGQAEYLAALLEIGEAYQEYGEKTGFALVIDAETREVVDRLMVDDDQAAMKRKIAAVVRD